MTAGDRRSWIVLLGILALTSGGAAAWLAVTGFGDANVRVPMRLTVQTAFVLYLVVLVARPLHLLLHKPWTATLLANRRLVGIAFAGLMTVHLGLVVLRFSAQADLEFRSSESIPGMLVYAIIYLMLVTSFDGPRRAIRPGAWKALHMSGLIVIGVAFGLPRSSEDLSDPGYLLFGVPLLAALVIRISAWLRSRRRGS